MDNPGGYPSFVVMDTNKRKNVLVTQSARKAAAALEKGRRIAEKQRRHEERNARRR